MTQLRDIPGFGALVDGLTWAIGGFDNRDLAFFIALLILLGALAVFLALQLRGHRPWLQSVRSLTRGLQDAVADQSATPTQRIATADDLFQKSPGLMPLWQPYRDDLWPNPQVNGYRNLLDPRQWFAVEALPGRGYEQWCGTWAGVFLTVGLLFTFIGLSAALLKVGAIDGADSAQMKAAITGILGVSSAKFITSIAGLIAYIGFSLLTRHYQSTQQAAAQALAQAAARLSHPLTPERLLYDQHETGRAQLLRLERLTDDLAVAIDARL